MIITKSYARDGQDRWIVDQFPDGYVGWAIDIGAGDGLFFSNTLPLERDGGWNVLCVEADPRLREMLKINRKNFCMCAVAGKAKEWETFHCNIFPNPAEQSLSPRVKQPTNIQVPVLTINQLLHMFAFPRLDVLSIDIEGGEADALLGIDLEKWRPKVLVVEDWNIENSKIDNLVASFGYRLIEIFREDRCYLRNWSYP